MEKRMVRVALVLVLIFIGRSALADYPKVPYGLTETGTIHCKGLNKRFSVSNKYIKADENGIDINGICSGEIKDSYIDAALSGIKLAGNAEIKILNCIIIGEVSAITSNGNTNLTIKNSKLYSKSRGLVIGDIGDVKVINSLVNGEKLAVDVYDVGSLMAFNSSFTGTINLTSHVNKFEDLGENQIDELTQGESEFYIKERKEKIKKAETDWETEKDDQIRQKEKWQPIHIALYEKDTKKAEGLLLKGADVNSMTATGRTPLHFAAWYDEALIVSLLLAKGADRNIEDCYGMTPMDIAVFRNHPEIIKLLESGSSGV